ncbi:hypothetical protein [Aquimarina aggregata]|uniref:hypothetical protein n=1 Tax=Aquimarina aggregata TaxID=1642818 RepID=UPI002491F434|nr:hypothetical protein [Aquimarina aggregata]
MDKKEEELLSMHYQIEKTDIKQQKFEDRLKSISEDLKKSKRIRNMYFVLIIGLILLMIAGSFYLIQNNMIFPSDAPSVENSNEMKKLLMINDSLQQEVQKLKEGISEEMNSTKDSSEVYTYDSSGSRIVVANDSIGSDKDSLNKSKRKFKRQYGYVKKAFKSNDAIFVEVDFIEFYKGRLAVKKAKEYGEAEYDIDKKGDTLYFLYNNYYIHNKNSSSRILELDDKVRVKIDKINQISNGFPLKAFQKIILDQPVLILETNNDIVYKISQQKLL